MATPKFLPGSAGARALDAADELAPLRREFELPRERRPHADLPVRPLARPHAARGARAASSAELDRWAKLGVDGHFPDARPPRGRPRALRAAHGGWLDYHAQFAPLLAELVGAQRDEVVAMNTLTVNLHLMLATFFRPTPQRYKILIERDAFSVGSLRRRVATALARARSARRRCSSSAPRAGSFELDRERYDALLARARRAASRSCCCPACSI